MQLVAPADAFNATVMKEAKKERPRKRLIELMQSLHAPDVPDPPPPPTPAEPRAIRVAFQRNPVGFVGDGSEGPEHGKLRGVRLARTELQGEPGPNQKATAVPGSEYELPCGLALRAVGYRSTPLEGAPFDETRGIVPSDGAGRVDGCTNLYVSGWLKRGPSGVILTNVTDAADTANALLTDRSAGALSQGGSGVHAVRELLSTQAAPVLDFDSWSRIDALEVARGADAGKVREKLVTVDEMIKVGAAPH